MSALSVFVFLRAIGGRELVERTILLTLAGVYTLLQPEWAEYSTDGRIGQAGVDSGCIQDVWRASRPILSATRGAGETPAIPRGNALISDAPSILMQSVLFGRLKACIPKCCTIGMHTPCQCVSRPFCTIAQARSLGRQLRNMQYAIHGGAEKKAHAFPTIPKSQRL